MTDKTIPADLVREIAGKMHHHANQEHVRRDAERYFRIFAKQLDDLLPPPPTPPTLAGMTEEERRACQWMQADVENRSVRYVIANPHDAEGDAALVDPYGEIEWFSPERVTPRPDLPPMTWPGDQKPAPALPEGDTDDPYVS